MNSAEANTPLTAIQEQKKAIREQAHANRKDQEHKDELSREICARFMALPEYQRARTAMFYVDVRTEVRTRQDLATALAHGKTIVVPWCNDQGELELFRLESMEDLALGMYKILEPKPELRHLPERQVDVKSLDILLGRKRVYVQEPRYYYLPQLPQKQFYDRADFPWLDQVEAATDDIRAELLNVLQDSACCATIRVSAASRCSKFPRVLR